MGRLSLPLPPPLKEPDLSAPMTWHNKVMWTEGMFLQPQHFQQQDRYAARQLDARLAATAGRGQLC